MNANDIKVMAVLGAGVMGHGIAQLAAVSGFEVRLFDIDRAALDKGLSQIRANLDKGVEKGKSSRAEADAAFARVSGHTDMKEAAGPAQLVVEAAPERIELKRSIFKQLSECCAPDAILGTNTSSLSISEIADAATNPGRVIGMHFFNPPYIMKLLEVVVARQTSDETLALVKTVGAEKLTRDVIVVKDSPGFATSRLGLALGLEAIRMVEEGVASAQDIDTAMEQGYRHPMGPLKLTDMIGLDTRLNIASYLHETLGMDHFAPPALLRKMVAEGKLGKKSGQGFYSW